MASAPICITCNVERRLISIQPARNRHDMWQYECPNCRDIFRLVVQRESLESDEPVLQKRSLKTAAR